MVGLHDTPILHEVSRMTAVVILDTSCKIGVSCRPTVPTSATSVENFHEILS